ncbi:hypothetical protein ACFWPA_18705 [Rhodococcus sp. NPDC058505]|uniref:hypothetical protein n=1 Tax=Rhodococcus sp. NPDC058505 TaxID=3346531 RepID=UPI003668BCAC
MHSDGSDGVPADPDPDPIPDGPSPAARAAAAPGRRPPPPRPDFRMRPRRPESDAGPPRPATAALLAWGSSLALLAGIAAATVLDAPAVRDAIESALAAQNPGSSRRDVADVVSLTLLGAASIAALLAVATLIGMQLLRARRPTGRIVLIAVGTLSIAAAFGFWSLLAEAATSVGAAARWALAPYAVCVFAGVTLLFVPAVRTWMQARR